MNPWNSCLFSSCLPTFWSDINNWLSIKWNDLPALNVTHILLFKDNVSPSTSDITNIVIVLAKYHIHCCKWKGNNGSLSCFINSSFIIHHYWKWKNGNLLRKPEAKYLKLCSFKIVFHLFVSAPAVWPFMHWAICDYLLIVIN